METFGVRTAHELQRRMPNGPKHLGAERLTSMLAEMDKEHVPDNKSNNQHRRLDQAKPIRWGPQTSIDTSSGGPGAMGMSTYNGV